MYKSIYFSFFALLLTFNTSLARADGSFVGLGIVIQSEDKSIQIIDVYENSPASRANILPGEWVDAIDGKSTYKQKLKEVSKALKGELGTTVTLTIKDQKREVSRDLTLTRALVEYTCFIEGNISLNYYGTNGTNTGSFMGNIQGETVSFSVNGSYVSFYFRNQLINLNFESDFNGNIRLSGWINGSFVDWRGSGNNIFAYQSCIR